MVIAVFGAIWTGYRLRANSCVWRRSSYKIATRPAMPVAITNTTAANPTRMSGFTEMAEAAVAAVL